ncbi:TAXI family TRAP transporter solute-binding subunit [Bacillus sp. Marseille-P3661]|uniref:TAXI family TRAP transporter solute-binding subunit n=1 Tax=Bacillus sp. Marseille-P3661 TaxID=1936234 RepID=UPI000C85CC4A|nr:TAXI family TRAP transporter solute-binding subunit [Bacillus sp. Marseille-P3661]
MKKRLGILSLICLLTIMLLAACGGSGSEQAQTDSKAGSEEKTESTEGSSGENATGEIDDSVAIGTHSAGSGYHTVGSGLAKIISDNTPIRGNVRPTAGPQAWINDLNSGNLEFGLINNVDIAFAYNGGPGYEKPIENIRTVFGGMPMNSTGWTVRRDSGITSISELKGQPVASGFGGNFLIDLILRAELESVGLTYDDVKPVPVPEFQASLDAIQENMVAGAYAGSPDSAKAQEVGSAIGGLRVLPFGDLKPEDISADGKAPAEKQALLEKYLPGASFSVVPAGVGVLEEDTVHIRYDMTLVASADVSADTVYTVLKSIWENYEEMHGLISYTNDLSPEVMPRPNPGAPYHEGAIKFYKEMGVWTDEHEKLAEYTPQ